MSELTKCARSLAVIRGLKQYKTGGQDAVVSSSVDDHEKYGGPGVS